jgi:nicotinate-nucleotide adenylyltransferase
VAGLIGVLGGTFDPPHLGHQILADDARLSLRLEKVLWVLTPDPPHKPNQPISALDVRLEMVKETIRYNTSFELSRVDIERSPPHYALGTMKSLQNRYRDQHFIYLMGSDSLVQLPTWHNPQAFLDYCDAVAVLSRRGAPIDLHSLEESLPGIRSKVIILDSPSIDVSSQEIRERVKNRIAFEYLVPYGVATIIEKYNLYQ